MNLSNVLNAKLLQGQVAETRVGGLVSHAPTSVDAHVEVFSLLTTKTGNSYPDIFGVHFARGIGTSTPVPFDQRPTSNTAELIAAICK